MRQFVMGCTVAGLLAISARTVAEPPWLEAGRAPLLVHEEAQQVPAYDVGIASWYGEECDGNLTASGEVFDLQLLTAAHPTLPFGTLIKVTNLRNDRSLVLRVNDRGPGILGRLLDVSEEAAWRLGFHGSGIAPVLIKVVGHPKARSNHSDSKPPNRP